MRPTAQRFLRIRVRALRSVRPITLGTTHRTTGGAGGAGGGGGGGADGGGGGAGGGGGGGGGSTPSSKKRRKTRPTPPYSRTIRSYRIATRPSDPGVATGAVSFVGLVAIGTPSPSSTVPSG